MKNRTQMSRQGKSWSARTARFAYGAAALALCAGTSLAKAAETPAPSDEPATQEIIVTAQKREQSINDVGLAITAISGDTLKGQQINSLADIANVVPGLSFSNSGQNTPIYTLRGVGFSESSLGAYPDVAVYLDEVPLPFPALTTLTAFDLERIEVLKGPQGTLFGNNATGGAINYVAAKPSDRFGAGVNLSYGRFNTISGEGYVTGPLGSTINARIAGKIVHGDEWQHGYTNDAKVGKARTYAGRLQLDWQATSGLRFALNVNGWVDKSDPQALQFQIYRSNVGSVDAPPAVVNYPRAPENSRAADFSGNYSADNSLFQAALRTELDITDKITLTSLTSYIDYKHDISYDQDGLTFQNFDIPSNIGDIESISQEIRLDNGSGPGLRWVIGANYGRDKVHEDFLQAFRDSSAFNVLGVTIGGARSDQVMKNYAAFANAEYDITEQLTLKAGGRYTRAERSFDGCTYAVPGGGVKEAFVFIAGLVSGVTPPTPADGECITIRPDYLSLGNFVSELNEDNFSWRVGLDYKPNPDILLYANVAKGYKAGSYPIAPASTTTQFLPVKQESVLDYEAGFKLTLLDRALQLNGTAFYYDYRDKQLRSKLRDPVWGLLDNLQNVPESTVKGLELEVTARPFAGFTLSAAATYLDAKVKKFQGINAGGVDADFAGTRVPFTPKYQFSINPSYEFPINDSLRGFLGATVNYRSSTNAVVGGSTILVAGQDVYAIDGYTLVDGRIGVRSDDDRWEAQIWGKNIFNKYYWTNVLVGYDTTSRYAGRPATYGVSLSYRFR